MVKDAIEEMLGDRMIRTVSPLASSITMVSKNGPGHKILHTLQKTKNFVKEKDAYQLIKIQPIFDELRGTKLFSTLDIKTDGFGLVYEEDNAHAAFQRIMG